MKAFDIPAEIVGAVIDTSTRGMDETTEALKDITKAMGGDAEALKRLPGHSHRIERTLSPRTYGQAMLKAMADRVIDRIPFARTLAKLFASPASGEPASPVSATAKVINLDWWSSASGSEINENDIYRCEPNPSHKGFPVLNRYAPVRRDLCNLLGCGAHRRNNCRSRRTFPPSLLSVRREFRGPWQYA